MLRLNSVNMTLSNTQNINGNLRSFALLTPTMDYTDDDERLIQPNIVNADGSYGTFWQFSGKSEIGAGRDNIYASEVVTAGVHSLRLLHHGV